MAVYGVLCVCVCVCVCLFVCLKSITCTLVQNGRFLAATGYVAPSPSPYNTERNVVYQIIMYLKSHIELNHGNPIQSQPHGPEPLSPQNTKEEKIERNPQKKEKNPASHRKPENPTPIPRNPIALPQLRPKESQTRPSLTLPCPMPQPKAPSP